MPRAQAPGRARASRRPPVLVRLHVGNFGYFADTKPDGADVRFIAGDDKTPLAFHIESWDADVRAWPSSGSRCRCWRPGPATRSTCTTAIRRRRPRRIRAPPTTSTRSWPSTSPAVPAQDATSYANQPTAVHRPGQSRFRDRRRRRASTVPRASSSTAHRRCACCLIAASPSRPGSMFRTSPQADAVLVELGESGRPLCPARNRRPGTLPAGE